MPIIAATIVEVCVFKMENGVPSYLLLHRSKEEKVYPGIWQFVSGSIEGKEKAVDAALRELLEETGLKPKSFWIVPFVNAFYDAGGDSINLSPMFAAEVHGDQIPVLSEEHYEFGWYSFENALKKLVWPGQREGVRIVQEYIVKGETAGRLTRIL